MAEFRLLSASATRIVHDGVFVVILAVAVQRRGEKGLGLDNEVLRRPSIVHGGEEIGTETVVGIVEISLVVGKILAVEGYMSIAVIPLILLAGIFLKCRGTVDT